jgi:hypothetical protein
MVLNVLVLIMVILISLIFKYYFFKMQLFKTNITEGLSQDQILSNNLPDNIKKLISNDPSNNVIQNTNVQAVSIQPIMGQINSYMEDIGKLGLQINTIQSEYKQQKSMLDKLKKDTDSEKNSISDWTNKITREKALLAQLATEETKLIDDEKLNIKNGILFNAQMLNEYNANNKLSFDNITPVISDDKYDYYVFLKGYTLFKCITAGNGGNADVFILGGGGAGGGNHGGGGGAGVPIMTTMQFQEGLNYSVTVGEGGRGGGERGAKNIYRADINNGKASEIWVHGELAIRAYGGFYGGGGNSGRAFNTNGGETYGGSGGGGMAYNYSSGDQLILTGGNASQLGSNNFGGSRYRGGNGAMYNGTAGNGGGGGGAAGSGENATNTKGGNGGAGIRSPYIPEWISSISKYMEQVNNDWNNITENGRVIAGGGGGGAWTQFLCSPGIGGVGGGGNGGACIGNYGQPGCPAPDAGSNTPVNLDNQHQYCDNPGRNRVCNNRNGSCGGGFVNIINKGNNNYLCTNPGGPWKRLSSCPPGSRLEPSERTTCLSTTGSEYDAISGGQRYNVIGIPGKDGFPNTGSGGGGGSSTGFAGGSGGSGIVIIRSIKQGTGYNMLNPVIYAPLEENLKYSGRFFGDAQVVGNVSFTTINNKKCTRFSNSMSNYITIPFQNPSSFTFCYWIYVIDRSYYTAVSLCGSNFGNVDNPCIQCDFGEPTVVFVAALPWRWTAVTNNSQSFMNKWTHVTYIVNQDNSTMQLYVNGQAAGSATGRGRLGNTKDFFVIGRSGDNYRAFNGYISQFYYFDRVLSAQDITTIYTAGKKDISTAPEPHWEDVNRCKFNYAPNQDSATSMCPGSKPTCNNFIEGRQWGTCS